MLSRALTLAKVALMPKPAPHDIDAFATRLANARPARPASAARERERITLSSCAALSARYWLVQAQVSDALARSLHHPAQYTTFKIQGLAPRFLAIASAPGARAWEFIIDRDSSIGEALHDLDASTEITLSKAEGSGFLLDKEDLSPLLCFATGSGIATLRPVFEWLEREAPHHFPQVRLYYGERRAQDFLLAAEIERWEQAGATTLRASEDGRSGERGWRYVQHAFLEDAPLLPSLSQHKVLLSGAPIMLRMVSELLLEHGLSREQLLTNI